MQMATHWRRRSAIALIGLSFAGMSMGASSCAESVEELDKAGDDLEDASGGNDRNYRQKIKQVSLGMTKSEVRSIMGSAPRDKQRMESEFGVTEMWYYGSWQLGFTDGKLDSKNKY
jgi:outer membrane protein assembly factor BamE (lipoprotein component of BamABCDE complex)